MQPFGVVRPGRLHGDDRPKMTRSEQPQMQIGKLVAFALHRAFDVGRKVVIGGHIEQNLSRCRGSAHATNWQ